MALNLDPSSAKMQWKTSGAAAACHTGTRFALLHCTKGANLGAGDHLPAGKVTSFQAIDIEGSVFLEATANEFDLGGHEFGMVQVTEITFYEMLFAGRRATEGSCNLNMKAGFNANPCLDVQGAVGQTVDEHIFDTANLEVDRITTPRVGFNVTCRFGDHPNNAVPYRFENRRTGASNYLALAARAQKFTVFFLARANKGARPLVLGRLTWAVAWLVEFSWAINPLRATANVRKAEIIGGSFQAGPTPLDGAASIAIRQTAPTANKQDGDAVNAIYAQHRAPLLTQSTDWPPGFRDDFFS